MRLMPIRKSCIAALVALGVAVALMGCGGGGGGGGGIAPGSPDNTLPTATVTSFTRLLSATGGTAQFVVQATDAGGIAGVTAEITPPDGGAKVTLTLSMAADGFYKASYQAPANSTTQAKTYTFTVRAVDRAGNQIFAGPYSFEVPSAETPPPPPPFSVN